MHLKFYLLEEEKNKVNIFDSRNKKITLAQIF